MDIDWITVAAQIVNFLILVFLLQRFLYQPVIQAMDRREQRMSERLANAREREEEAEERAQSYREAQEELAERREETLAAAQREADATRARLLEEARDEVAARRQAWRSALAADQKQLERRLCDELAKAATAIAERAVGDLAGRGLNEAVFERFLERVDNAEAAPRETLESLRGANGTIAVRSSFALGEQDRERLRDVLARRLEAAPSLHLKTDAELVCGIALEGAGQRLSWSISAYLADVEEELSALLEGTLGEPAE